MRFPGFTAEVTLVPKAGRCHVRTAVASLSAAGAVTPQGIPIYGNYCGPGFGDSTYRTPAIDTVDHVCKDHDHSYDQKGYFDCECDRNLIAHMSGAIATAGLSALHAPRGSPRYPGSPPPLALANGTFACTSRSATEGDVT